MSYAINIRSDHQSSEKVETLWAKYESLEKTPSMHTLGYRPHLTLAIYDEVDLETLKKAFELTFKDRKSITVRFEELSYFESPESYVLWLKPTDESQLWEIHQQIHSLINTKNCKEHYRPKNWVPHCSIATAIESDRQNDVLAITKQPFEPFEVVFDVADYVAFLPVQIMQEIHLNTVKPAA